MTTIEDIIDDEQREDVEQAELESRRAKTEYGPMLNGRDEDDEEND